jgi:hypothetical protein
MNSQISFIFLIQASNGLREEAQRYMGYESLPIRYFSLPFDTTMGTNLNLLPYDIGFLFLVFFPLCFIWYFKKSFFWLLPFFVLFLVISIPTAFAAYQQISLEELSNLPIESSNILNKAILGLVLLLLPLTSYIENIFNTNAAFTAGYTYFILFLAITFIIWTTLIFQKKYSEKLALMLLFLLLVFLWILLSGGIPWYGIFILPIGVLLIVLGSIQYPIMKPFIIFSIGLWFFFRISGYYSKKEIQSFVVEAATIQYQIGVLNENKYQEILTKTPSQLIDFLNQNMAEKIYRNGTNLHYFLKNNHTRVLEDNQLGTFNMLYQNLPDKIDLISAFENSGFKYLIIDLNMANIDRTPEKTLLAKYENLIKVLYENPKLQLIYTDRIVRSNETGQPIQMMFDKGQQILNPGSLAVFMII